MYVTEQITRDSFTQDTSTKPIQNIWNTVFDFNFSAEDRLIAELKDHNTRKFQTLQSIIQTELDYTRAQREYLENMSQPDIYTQTNFNPDVYRFDIYKQQMEDFNIATLESIIQIAEGPSEDQLRFERDLESDRASIMDTFRGKISERQDASPLMSYNLLANNTNTNSSSSTQTVNSCDI